MKKPPIITEEYIKVAGEVLAEHASGKANAKPIAWVCQQVAAVLQKAPIQKKIFQQQVMNKHFRNDEVFVGASKSGIYKTATVEDCDTAIKFYEKRIAAEECQVRKLKRIRAKLCGEE